MKNNISVEGSLKFRDKNFYYAIGHADIKNMHINRNGDIDLLVTDVYDFNPNSPSDLIQVIVLVQRLQHRNSTMKKK